MEPVDLHLTLIPSAGDALLHSETYQEELRAFQSALQTQMTVVVRAQEAPRTASTGSGSSARKETSGPALAGEFILKTIPVVLASSGFTGVLTAWIGRKNGRKVRLKVGDIEVEASTVEEAEKLLARAQEIQQRNQPSKVTP